MSEHQLMQLVLCCRVELVQWSSATRMMEHTAFLQQCSWISTQMPHPLSSVSRDPCEYGCQCGQHQHDRYADIRYKK